MNNNTKLRIRGSRKLFESIALEILAEAKGGKSHAQKLTEKMMGKKKKEKMEEAPKEKEEVKKLKEFDDFEDGDLGLDEPLGMGPEMSTEEDLKNDLIKAGFSEEEAIKTAAQLVKIGKTKK